MQAGAGWGKSTAARIALRGRDVRWLEARNAPAESGALAFLLAEAFGLSSTALGTILKTARSNDDAGGIIEWLCAHRLDLAPLIAIDDLHLLADDSLSMALLAGAIERLHDARWLLLSRRALPLPWANWLATGDASLPVVADDLALEAHEAQALLEGGPSKLDAGAIRAIVALADGWPVVLRFAKRAADRAGDLVALQAMTREMAFTYLAEQLANEASPECRELVRIAAFARWIDASLLARMEIADPHAALRWLRESPLPLHDTGLRVALHDLAAESFARSLDTQTRAELLGRLVTALREEGRVGEAIDLARTYAPERIDALLHSDGFALIDDGRWESVEQALHGIAMDRRRSEPTLLGLRAALEAFHGSIERAEQLYVAGIRASSDPELHSTLSRRLTLLYINLARPEALNIIESAVDEGSDASRADARSIHALALVVTGNLNDAKREVTAALEATSIGADDSLVARILMRAAWIAFHCGDSQHAQRHAESAVRLATRIGDDRTCAHSYSILCSISIANRGDMIEAYALAQEMKAAAERASDQQLSAFATQTMYYAAAERSQRARIAELETDRLKHSELYRDDFFARFAQAMVWGWSNRFHEGLALLEQLGDTVTDPAERYCWKATQALFTAFAQKDREAKALLADARALESSGIEGALLSRRFYAVGRTHAAFAELFVGRPYWAMRIVPKRAAREHDLVLLEMLSSLAALPSLTLGSATPTIEMARKRGREGFADLIAAALELAPREVDAHTLTESEVAILKALASGASNKRVAMLTGRSIETVRSHTKAIFRKLGVEGRAEAVALARQLGLLE